jgi:hypothetical protein
MPSITNSAVSRACVRAVRLGDPARETPQEPSGPGNRQGGSFCLPGNGSSSVCNGLRTGLQTRVMRVRSPPPMHSFGIYECPIRTIDNYMCQPAVGQWPGHLIWVEGDGGSSPSSWTRRPQHACYRPSGRPKTCPARESARHPAQGARTLVAQVERAPAYEAGGCRFESCRACCVRGRSGRGTGMWPRRKRVRAPPDTLCASYQHAQ